MTQLVNALRSVEIDAGSLGKLEQFRDLFAKWNERINLSAAGTRTEIEEHIRDSLPAIPHLRGAASVIDVGSGGGFPVVIAAICLPDVAFTSLEPVHKKHAFLRTAARELQLPNLSAFARRLEDHAERDYDVASSRATFDLREWILRGLELVRVNGRVIGFEATPRDDLPAPFERHSYELDGKRRSIIVATRLAS
ncbi:MAG: 16S rRNA (guanine(527)-N(7))-methyltransferase RsmG [Actinobacteria bacterium]|nr:16S rRNA (guanine(527)-N(7))-methyltransferase RsmG [Actinomycetota bacterium]